MLEIFALIVLTRSIGKIVEQKGYNSRNYKILTVVLWFGGEILGLIIGASLAESRQSRLSIMYTIGLEGALVGAAVAYAIARNLSSATLTRTPAEQVSISTPKGQLPALVIGIMWVMSNGLANLGWSWLYNLLNPTFGESLNRFAYITSGIAAGAIAGILQWLILSLVLSNRDRRGLVGWVPASIIGWSIVAIVQTPIGSVSGWVFLFIWLLSGTIIGVSQWFILRKYSEEAILWILANAVDWTLAWMVILSSLLSKVTNVYVNSILFGLVGSIVSSATLVFVLRKYRTGFHYESTEVLPANN